MVGGGTSGGGEPHRAPSRAMVAGGDGRCDPSESSSGETEYADETYPGFKKGETLEESSEMRRVWQPTRRSLALRRIKFE
jgi:hypothetical protein